MKKGNRSSAVRERLKNAIRSGSSVAIHDAVFDWLAGMDSEEGDLLEAGKGKARRAGRANNGPAPIRRE